MSPVLEYAAATTLLLGCLTATGIMLKRLWNGTRKVVHAVEIIQRELNPNGGGSTYDRAKIAAEAAVRAESKAEQVAADLAVFRQHQADDTATTTSSINRLQHDLTNVRAGQEMLIGQQNEARVEMVSSIEQLHGQITAEAGERMADALDLLAEHGGPDLRPHLGPDVAPHAHALPTVQAPSVTGGPVEPKE